MIRCSLSWPALIVITSVVVGSPGAASADENEKIWAEQDFLSYCAPCHGLEGRGDGPVADHLKIRPSDLTAISRRSGGTFPFDATYAKIEGLDMPGAHGTSKMPIWGLWFTNQAIGESVLLDDAKPAEEKVRQRIRAIVTYLQTLQE